jgi:hypothetical protein
MINARNEYGDEAMNDKKPEIISLALVREHVRKLSHLMTMDALEKLRSGKQKTLRLTKLYCRCDACQTLTNEVTSKLRY